MTLWYLSRRRPAKARASLRICAVSPEPSLFAHMKYGSRRRIGPKIRHLAPLDSCACAFEELSLWRTKSAIISWAGSFVIKGYGYLWSVIMQWRKNRFYGSWWTQLKNSNLKKKTMQAKVKTDIKKNWHLLESAYNDNVQYKLIIPRNLLLLFCYFRV